MVESKQCRVIVTCWNNHRSPINNSPPSPGAVYHFFKNEVIKAEMKMKSDIPYDIIIINHFWDDIVEDNKFQARMGDDYLIKLNNTKTPNGIIKTVTIPNQGVSFDGFRAAYYLFNHIYDYFLFTEDDHKLFRDNYYTDLLKEYTEGVLACAPFSRDGGRIHTGGAFCLWPTKVLKKLEPLPRNWGTPEHISVLEQAWTGDVMDAGIPLLHPKKLSIYNINKHLTQHSIRENDTEINPKDTGDYFYQVGKLKHEKWKEYRRKKV
jgi:hypothetical protein